MSTSPGRYEPSVIEPKWQRYWLDNKTFRAVDGGDKPKYYVLDMFPYPSGEGLHVGHPIGWIATDVLCRYKRMCGFNVLHPMGWDAFGLPAEQYAVDTGTHPATTTAANIVSFIRQIRSIGFSYDWTREINTSEPDYYRWTQWIFLKLYEKGLAYLAEMPVNWCPALGTVLANEEVIDGLSERGSHPVERRPMRQWVLKITEYAERLLDDLDDLDWPEGIKEMQRNWIGKSTGAEVCFEIMGQDESVTVFTTRPDTLFGATYMVFAPEHPLVEEITTPDQSEAITAYQAAASRKSDMARTDLATEKTGVFTGASAVNPVNGAAIPIWISDYVMMGYGTGAIMAVPAHDTRDFEFAQAFDLPIRAIIEPMPAASEAAGTTVADVLAGEACWTGDGTLVNSRNDDGLDIDGMNVPDAIATTNRWLEDKGLGKEAVNYKLRDWLFSRQRYWGEPFPLIHMEDGTIRTVPEENLPVILPEIADYQPTGDGHSPLAKAEDWLDYTDPETGAKGKRETHTMPQWAGSCWYYLRYLDPHNDQAAWDLDKEKYWMPVDLYVGGAEHAVLHLLYARFWHKVLFDLGYVSTKEPFKKLVNQGMVIAWSFRDDHGRLVDAGKVEEREPGRFFHVETDAEVKASMGKMGKSLKNAVNPDDVVVQYGADSFRLYEMFMGPITAQKPWSTQGVEGVYRFVQRSWRMIIGPDGALSERIGAAELTDEQRRVLHTTIKKVGDDFERLSFNTAISQLMVFINEFSHADSLNREAMESFVKLLSPLAPHVAEELWQKLGHTGSIAYESWPEYLDTHLKVREVEILIQVNGKPKHRLMMSPDLAPEEMEAQVKADHDVAALLAEKETVKIICVPGRLVNFVVR